MRKNDKINLACGNRYHKDWVNVDFSPKNNQIRRVNLLKTLPFDNNTFNFAYCGHFLEHLTPEQAYRFLKEVKRILKKGGILRIVVPDLENVCREYLDLLDKQNEQYKLEWIYIELIDQMVRVKSGGKMTKFYSFIKSSDNVKLAKYINERTGVNLLSENDKKQSRGIKMLNNTMIINKLLKIYLRLIKLLIPESIRSEIFIDTSIGERHKWMYDYFSLSGLIKRVGFRNVTLKKFNTSQIDKFNNYFLDMNDDGTPYKGVSSLHIECKK